jgi:hypothetical protein
MCLLYGFLICPAGIGLGCSEPIDFVEPLDDLVPTGWH